MHIKNVIDTVVAHYENAKTRTRTLMLLGPSGVGKSDAVRAAAEELRKRYGQFDVIDLRLSQFDPVDFRGVPSVVDARTTWNVPVFFPQEGTRGIIFLDEITSAPQAVQAVAYQLTNDRRVGEYVLPEGWMVMAAGNRMSDRGVTFNLAAPLLNRMTVIEVHSSLEDFVDYCVDKGVAAPIIAFLKTFPQYLNERDEKINVDCQKLPVGKPFATQRAWTTGATHYLDYPSESRIELLSGSIGERATADFEAFLRIWETMPSVGLIFSDNNGSVPVPTQKEKNGLATLYAISVAIALRVDGKTFGTVLPYLERMPKEFRTLVVKMAFRRDRSISTCDAFHKWMKDNADILRIN